MKKFWFESDWKMHPKYNDILVSDDGRNTHRGYHFEYVEDQVYE